MVLAAPGPLLTPPPSSSFLKTPFRSYSAQIRTRRGNAFVLKTPVENAPRTSIEKHLSWSPDIPPEEARVMQRVYRQNLMVER